MNISIVPAVVLVVVLVVLIGAYVAVRVSSARRAENLDHDGIAGEHLDTHLDPGHGARPPHEG